MDSNQVIRRAKAVLYLISYIPFYNYQLCYDPIASVASFAAGSAHKAPATGLR